MTLADLKKRYQFGISNNKSSDKYLENRLRNLVLGFNLNSAPELEKQLGLEFLPEEPKEGEVCFAQSPELRDEFKTYFTSLNLLDYMYAVIHSPSYLKTHQESFKIDFLQIGKPKDPAEFWKLTDLGNKLRAAHVLKKQKTDRFITTYPIKGSNKITKNILELVLRPSSPHKKSKKQNLCKPQKQSPGLSGNETPSYESQKNYPGRVWINDVQYFDHVPKSAWKLYLGYDRPAQKWLKDRMGQSLDHKAILAYQQIISALMETKHLMKEIKKIENKE